MELINRGYIIVPPNAKSLLVIILDIVGFEFVDDNILVDGMHTVEINEDGDIEEKLRKVVNVFNA